MDKTDLISLTKDGDAATLTLQRPPLNLLNLDLLGQLEAHLESLMRTPELRAVIIDSEAQAFCAGLEPSELTRDAVFLLLEQFHLCARHICSFPRPTIALVRGLALGAGNELAACCDFILASEKASFGHPEIKIGSIPSLAPLLLPSLIGQRRALEMILTGRFLSAQEAEGYGLVFKVLPDDRLSKGAEELMATFRGLSNAVLEVALRSVRLGRTKDWDRHVREVESLYLNELMELEDATEGVRALIEKRPPRWKNQ
jgi:cyclohexa-1,5-dienecarbonyl-CoA hydratase